MSDEKKNDIVDNEMKEVEPEVKNDTEIKEDRIEDGVKGGTVYINNLPKEEEIKEEEIKEMFSEFGEIDKVKIVLEHDSKKPKGYAFIE